jgi:hypothetical protein
LQAILAQFSLAFGFLTEDAKQPLPQPLGRGIEHPISAIGIVEAIAERSIGTCKRPVGWLPRVGAATDPKNRTLRFNAEWNGLSSGHECADSAQNLRAHNFEVALA